MDERFMVESVILDLKTGQPEHVATVRTNLDADSLGINTVLMAGEIQDALRAYLKGENMTHYGHNLAVDNSPFYCSDCEMDLD